MTATGTIADLIFEAEHFLMERKTLHEYMADINERLKRGEWVMMGSAPVAPAERGEELLALCVEALKLCDGS